MSSDQDTKTVLDRFRIDGRVAIVTGASSGLGAAIARALAEAGRLDLASMISHRIKLEEINTGIDLLTRAEGVRTVVL